ncbi:MAG: carbohydrate-binding family 9-like protein, partial [Bacteroidales bacterium]
MRFYKILEIRKEIFPAEYPDLRDVSEQLDNPGSRHFIDQINWKIFNFKPEVRFSISYSNREIFLKYYVNENYFKAEKTNHNEKVWEDSCVEFFIEPAGDGIYYNM